MLGNTSKRVRPQRTRRATKKHADSVLWTEETMQILRASSESSDRSSTSSDSDVRYKDGDVVFEDLAAEPIEDDEEEDIEQDQMSEDSIQPASRDETPHTPRSKRRKTGRATDAAGGLQIWRNSKASFAGKGVRNRMMLDSREIIRSGNSDCVYQQNYGPLLEDLHNVLRSRNIWHVFPRDITLPSKLSLSTALRLLPKGYLRVQVALPEAQITPSLPFTDRPALSQISRSISLNQAFESKYFELCSAQCVVLGPWSSAQGFTAEYLKPLDVSTAWARSQSGIPQDKTDRETNPWHKAWLINIGARPDRVAWAYCNSDTQFLAVSFRCSEAQRAVANPRTSKLSPAFSPSPAYPSNVQIWRIKANPISTPNEPSSIDFSMVPALCQVLCIKWGNILRLEWVPLLEGELATDMETRSMALLTSDGCIRIIDVDLQPTQDTTYIEYDLANILIKPPSTTIFTVFCFASKSDIFVGAADGTIRVYNLADSTNSGNTPKSYLTHQIHPNYIMAIAVAPERPYYICSSSASGDLVLTDLRSPNIDKIALHKARHPTRNLSYLPFIRTFITTNDGAGNSEPTGTAQCSVVSHSIRHFQYTNTIMKLPDSSGLTTCLATSSFHPCLLVANAQGSVFATNHLRRYLPISRANSSWMQKIFEYDWQPLAPSSSLAEQAEPTPTHVFVSAPSNTVEGQHVDIYHGRDPRPGISRIHEGFHPERVDLGIQSKRMARKATTQATTQAVFHEEQAVTAMAWNPNPKFAGWAAVAWGSGFLRIQDLSHDLG